MGTESVDTGRGYTLVVNFRLKLRVSIPLCMMNIIIFIPVKTQLLNYLMTIIRRHVSTQWGSSSGLYKELKTILIYNII
jgi:hypothetical protein